MAQKRSRLTSHDSLLDTVRNLPSDQVALVERALLGAMLSTAVMLRPGDRSIAATALSFMTNRRRSVTALDPERAVPLLFNALLLPDQDYADTIIAAQLERGLIWPFVMQTAELMVVPPEKTPALTHLRVLARVATRFRELLIERFEPVIDKTAGSLVWVKGKNGINIDPDDARQDHRMAAMRAADKFNPNKGTITSYVMLWMKNAANSPHSIATGESFTVTRSERARMQKGLSNIRNFSLPLEDAAEVAAAASEAHDDLEGMERIKQVIELLRGTPEFEAIKSALAAVLAPYRLTEAEKEALRATVSAPPRKERSDKGS